MSFTIPLSMTPQNLQPFRAAWQLASDNAAALTADMLERCRHLDIDSVPTSLQPHIGKVGALAEMLDDRGWVIDDATRRELAGALVYFDNADDLIPDSDPHFGLLDDAIVIEMALEEHRETWAAWQDYRRFCATHRELGPLTGGQWRQLCDATQRMRSESFVEPRYARLGQRSRYRLLDPLPRIDLN
jgi:hypothetical protein